MFNSIVLTKVVQKIKTTLFEFDKVIIVRPTYISLKGFGQKIMRINMVAFLIIRRQMR